MNVTYDVDLGWLTAVSATSTSFARLKLLDKRNEFIWTTIQWEAVS